MKVQKEAYLLGSKKSVKKKQAKKEVCYLLSSKKISDKTPE
jgi:hypothetical protein